MLVDRHFNKKKQVLKVQNQLQLLPLDSRANIDVFREISSFQYNHYHQIFHDNYSIYLPYSYTFPFQQFRYSIIIFAKKFKVVMNSLQVQPQLLHLQGITRSSYFRIVNHNDFLAVSFTILMLDDAGKALKIFPENGLLMHGQQQRIRIKHNSENTSCSENVETHYRLIVRFTYKTQYNKRYLAKNNMGGWNELSQDVLEKEVEIVSGMEKQAIQNYIKEQIIFQKTFGTDDLNLSAIKKQEKEQVENESFMTLNISSRLDDKKAFSSQRNEQQEEMEKSIRVDQIFPLQFGESRARNYEDHHSKKQSVMTEQRNNALVQSKLIKEQLSKSFSITMKTAQKNSFGLENSFNSTCDPSKGKTLELIILAVISAFFVALGNNIKRVIS